MTPRPMCRHLSAWLGPVVEAHVSASIVHGQPNFTRSAAELTAAPLRPSSTMHSGAQSMVGDVLRDTRDDAMELVDAFGE